MIMRKLLEKLGNPPGEDTEAAWEGFETYNDEQILPISPEEPGIPDAYGQWDGKTRNLVLLPDINMVIYTVRSFQVFKEVIEDMMTEKGASALLNGVGKKAGMAIGERFVKYLGWKDLQNAFDTVHDVSGKLGLMAGWGSGSAAVQTGKDGKTMLLVKFLNSFEPHGQSSAPSGASRPVCIIISSFLNGIWSTAARVLGEQAAEVREVRCTGKSDDYCAFAVKIKDKNAPPLDWKELEAEWQAMDG
jgi:predicted hydrocarbon binding protein